MEMKRPFFYMTIILTILFFCIVSCAPTEVVQPQREPARIALALGGGAARGFAHIGVLKVLESNHIPIHMIIGTSAGSFVGGLYAYGFNAFQIQKLSLEIQRGDIADFTLPDNGFIKGDLLEDYVNRMVRNTSMDKMRTPFYAVATELPGGKETVFASGNTGKAIRASCSIPGVFQPVTIGDKMYVDGGVVSPVPVDAARRLGANVVIAVDISSDLDTAKPSGTIETILQSINIMNSKISIGQLSKADVVIRPLVGYIGSADFDRRNEAIMEGEKATLQVLPRIQEIVEQLRQQGRLR
ncbi:MAG TPA: patatin-like phospholipase family protein [Dissulfurispiraceae bacterium]|nr:patatin-like phospholipase family protein [Dissulfurispiraceae bacterium]